MGLSFLFRFLTQRPGSGLFDYLKSRNANRTKIELERERRVTSLEVIGQLGPGDEYRESTTVGWREIRKAQGPPNALVVLSETGSDQQTPRERAELPSARARQLDQLGMPEYPHPNYLGYASQTPQPGDLDGSTEHPTSP